MPARAPIWNTEVALRFNTEVPGPTGMISTEEIEEPPVQAEKLERRGGFAAPIASTGVIEMVTIFKVRRAALQNPQTRRDRTPTGLTEKPTDEQWVITEVATPQPDMDGNRGASDIVFLHARRDS